MKVYAFTKIKANPRKEGTTTGDIIYIYPIDVPQARLDINDFMPVLIDLNVPCGENYRLIALNDAKAVPCVECQYNDIDLCDVRKYTQAVWSDGDLKTPPQVIKARRYNIDRTQFISGAESDALVTNDDKTDQEKILSFDRANKNEQPVSIVADKLAAVRE
jgi:hypothetical protein